MASPVRQKWDRASGLYDRMVRADDVRFGAAKAGLFRQMRGCCLMMAAGTGHDFAHFPPGLRVVAIDISGAMLARARGPARVYPGSLVLVQADAQALPFADGSFDCAVTSCTLCSVPDPVRGLREIRRVLRPEAPLLLFEHVRSRLAPVALTQDLLTPLLRRFGPDMNRDTVGNVQRAGFRVLREANVYLDIVKALEAVPA